MNKTFADGRNQSLEVEGRRVHVEFRNGRYHSC